MRLLELGSLLKLIIPLMSSDKGTDVVLKGVEIFKNLTMIHENNEFVKLKRGMVVLLKLYREKLHYKIVNICIIALGNLCKNNELLMEIYTADKETPIFEELLSLHLDETNPATQGSRPSASLHPPDLQLPLRRHLRDHERRTPHPHHSQGHPAPLRPQQP
jgi:hypothetical protein